MAAASSGSAVTTSTGDSGILNLAQDLPFAWRRLRQAPVFAVIVVATLAVGIGANAAVISVIDTAFFRKLPVPAPDRVVLISSGDTRDGARRRRISQSSFPDFLDLRGRVDGLSDMAAFARTSLKLGDELAGNEAAAILVTANYFDLLGVRPERGRFLAADEDQPRGAHPVVVISDAMWKTRFGGAANIVGRSLAIGNARFIIIGVAPAGFTGVMADTRADLWLPWTMQAEATGSDFTYDNRDARLAFIVGRLAPAAMLAQVQGSLDRAALDLRTSYPELDGSLRLGVQLHDRLVPIEQAPTALATFLLVWAMVGLLHLVACSNVASLMLARAAARRQELGIRLCLGASARRILAHTLAEPALLAALGAAGAVLVARELTTLITRMQFLSALDAGLDGRVLAIVALTAVGTMLAFGLLPAREAARSDPLAILRGIPDGRLARRRGDAAPLLVTGQVVMSLALLANAAVLLRTFQRQAVDNHGFDSSQLAVVSVTLREKNGFQHDWASLDQLTTRIAALPGVNRVAAADGAPLYRAGWNDEVLVTAHEYAEGESGKLLVQTIGPGYFATIGAPLVAGREFDLTERSGGAASFPGFDVAVVNEAMARRYWPGESAIGKRMAFRHRGSAIVTGVVRDIHDISLSAATPRVYFPLMEWRLNPGFELIVRTAGDPAALRNMLRVAVAGTSLSIEPPVVRSMDEILDDALSISRVGGLCVTIAAVLALLLTTVGLYGLVATWAAQRLREIGIRLALGARAADVHRLLLGGAARLIGAGALIGMAVVLGLLQVERAVWGPSIAVEVLPLLLAALLLALGAGVASWLPSRNAARLDPAAVIRSI